MAADKPFDRAMRQRALHELGRRCHASGHVVEIAIYGGCAVMLTLSYRSTTKDVDAVFERDEDFVRKIAADMARDYGWGENWLHDGVNGYLSAAESDSLAPIRRKTPGLRVFIPKPESLFALKCRAMRVGGIEGSQDIDDIRRLAEAIGMKSNEAMDLVQAFYPRHMIEPKSRRFSRSSQRVEAGLRECNEQTATDATGSIAPREKRRASFRSRDSRISRRLL